MSIAARLNLALKKREIGKKEFQRRMAAGSAKTRIRGTAYPQISAYLSGKRTPSVAFLERAADELTVRRAWLMAGDGAIDRDDAGPPREEIQLRDYHADSLPVPALDAWSEQLDAMGLAPKVRAAVHNLPFAMMDAIADLDVGNVLTLSGKRVYRPAPEYREAMRLQLVSWTGFFYQWVEEDGAEAVKKALARHATAVGLRFVRR